MKRLIHPTAALTLNNLVHLEWEIDSDEDLSGYTNIIIKKAFSPTDTFKVVATISSNNASWDDTDIPARRIWTELYYKIGMSNGQSFDFDDIIQINPLPTPLVLEMERRLRIKLERIVDGKRGVGLECYFLKRKHYGLRCSTCYDPYTSRQKKTHCSECYDTTFIGGYYKPVHGYVEVVSPDETVFYSVMGKDKNYNTVMITANYCWLQPGDIVAVVSTGKRYVIRVNSHSEYAGYRYPSQFLEVSELPKSDIIYEFKV